MIYLCSEFQIVIIKTLFKQKEIFKVFLKTFFDKFGALLLCCPDRANFVLDEMGMCGNWVT